LSRKFREISLLGIGLQRHPSLIVTERLSGTTSAVILPSTVAIGAPNLPLSGLPVHAPLPDTDAQIGGDLANAWPVFLIESAADRLLGLLVDLGATERPARLGTLRQQDVPELDLSDFAASDVRPAIARSNEQSADVFTSEQRTVEESAPAIVWRRPSDHDRNRLGDPLDTVVVTDTLVERLEVVGGGALRGIVLHKIMEEFLTGELEVNEGAAVSNAREICLASC
jgi:hypothetical protein